MERMTRREFELLAKQNNWEVYTQRQVYQFSQDILKSEDPQEREWGAIDYVSLSRVEVTNEDLTKSILFYREQQVEWDKAEDGTLMKARSGIYKDTPANRKKGIVGMRYGQAKKQEEPEKGKEVDEEVDVDGKHLRRARELGGYSKRGTTPENSKSYKKFEASLGNLSDAQKARLRKEFRDGQHASAVSNEIKQERLAWKKDQAQKGREFQQEKKEAKSKAKPASQLSVGDKIQWNDSELSAKGTITKKDDKYMYVTWKDRNGSEFETKERIKSSRLFYPTGTNVEDKRDLVSKYSD